jgi:DNA-binding GntR family transcriptional regulator
MPRSGSQGVPGLGGPSAHSGNAGDAGRRASAYDQIKEAILSGTLRPMERITESDVASRLGLSRTPVREAFGRLAAEGLIVVVPQRGSFVSQLRIDDILEIYQIRTPLECLAARIAAETIDESALAVLDRLVEVEAASQGARSTKDSLDANVEFHRIIIECVRNRRLKALVGQRRDRCIGPGCSGRPRGDAWTRPGRSTRTWSWRCAHGIRTVRNSSCGRIWSARASTLDRMLPVMR